MVSQVEETLKKGIGLMEVGESNSPDLEGPQ